MMASTGMSKKSILFFIAVVWTAVAVADCDFLLFFPWLGRKTLISANGCEMILESEDD